MDIATAYTRWSASYDEDRNLTRDLDAAATRAVLGDSRFGYVIEAGCGTGKNSKFLAEASGMLLGLDFSIGMLLRAQAAVGGAGAAFVCADLSRCWPCSAGLADLVTFNLVLEHLADLQLPFAEAARVLCPGGQLFVCELHPVRQYLGGQAEFVDGAGDVVRIASHVHHLSDFLQQAGGAGLQLLRIDEWWHEQDVGKPPRLLSMLFVKPFGD